MESSVDKYCPRLTNGTIGNGIGTKSTNVTNIHVRQEMTKTKYSMGKSNNAGVFTFGFISTVQSHYSGNDYSEKQLCDNVTL